MNLRSNAAEGASGTVAAAISDVCHELKTPLTIMMGYLDAIGSGLLANPQDADRILERTRGDAAA